MNTSKTAQFSTASMTTGSVSSSMTTGSVSSADGTTIGYLRVGQGPAVVIVHGSNESARSHTQLALALADAFTVYMPDRRGRGRSGPHRPGHSLRTEVEDLQAVLAGAGADKVFSVSIGGLIALEAARVGRDIRQLALYEPAILTAADKDRYTGWVPRFDEEMGRDQVAAAMITSMFGCDLAPPAFKIIPRRLLAAMTSAAMKKEDRQAVPGEATMRDVAPTLRYEGLLLAETAGTVSRYADVAADVLLIGGDLKRPAFLRPAFDAFARTLPHHRQAVFPGLDHGASGDPGPAEPGRPARRPRPGDPGLLQPAMNRPLSGPACSGQAGPPGWAPAGPPGSAALQRALVANGCAAATMRCSAAAPATPSPDHAQSTPRSSAPPRDGHASRRCPPAPSTSAAYPPQHPPAPRPGPRDPDHPRSQGVATESGE